jgi:cell division protein FtsI (penicillin-binding protein 3)
VNLVFKRLSVLYFFIGFLFVILFLRSLYLQLLPNKKIENLIEKQFHSQVKMSPKRPTIVDIKNRDLAVSLESYSLFADPTLIKKPAWVGSRLAKLLKEDSKLLVKKLKQKDSRFVWIKRFLEKETRDKILKMKLSEGIGFIPEFKRFYPNENLLSFALGQVGYDGHGLSGIERWVDQLIDLNSLYHRIPKDAKGRPLDISEKILKEFIGEKEVQLTIDSDIQYFFEKRLSQARLEQGAKAAFAIAMELPSQEIRAFAYESGLLEDKQGLKNPLLSHVYEFGSVLKPISIGGALESGLVTTKTTLDLEGGLLTVGDRKIKEAHFDPMLPSMNLSQILIKSSNIGTAKIAFKLGDQSLYETLVNFNFNEKTGLGLSGESRGILSKPPWSKHLLANISFGQGIALTPMQLLQAWSALATDGMIRTPVLVKQWKNSVTQEEIFYSTRVLKRALSEKVVHQLREILNQVTELGGTGERARIPGYQIAGKTGTAQKVSGKSKGYKSGAYITSFAGYFPSHNPQYVMIVVLDEPQKDYYASQSAAPLFAELGTYLVRKQGLEPSNPFLWKNHLTKKIQTDRLKLEKIKFTSQSVQGLSLPLALEILKNLDLPLRIRGEGQTVIQVEAHLNSETQDPEFMTLTVE